MEIEEEEVKDLNSNKKWYIHILALMDDVSQINNILISI